MLLKAISAKEFYRTTKCYELQELWNNLRFLFTCQAVLITVILNVEDFGKSNFLIQFVRGKKSTRKILRFKNWKCRELMTPFASSCEPLLTWVVSLIAEGLFVDAGAYTWEQRQQRHRNQAAVWGGRQEQEKAVLTVLEDVLLQSQALVAPTCTRFEGSLGFIILQLLLCASSLARGTRRSKQWIVRGLFGFWVRAAEDESEIPKLVFLLPSLIWFFHWQPSVPLLRSSLFSTQIPQLSLSTSPADPSPLSNNPTTFSHSPLRRDSNFLAFLLPHKCNFPAPFALPGHCPSPGSRWLLQICPVASAAEMNLLEGSLEGQKWICSWGALSIPVYKRGWGKNQIWNPAFSDSYVK